jgi:drug/metabolite transporter (DMT)-like permease
MIWLILTLSAIILWGTTDILLKKSLQCSDSLSHFKTFVWIGLIAASSCVVVVLCSDTLPDSIRVVADNIYLIPVTVFYVVAMFFGLLGAKHLDASVVSPLENIDGAITAIILYLFFFLTGRSHVTDSIGIMDIIGTVAITMGVILLGFQEHKLSKQEINLEEDKKKHRLGALALLFPIAYNLADAVSMVATGIAVSGEAEVEIPEIDFFFFECFGFLVISIFVWLYMLIVKKHVYNPFKKAELSRLGAATCETLGTLTFVFAVGINPILTAPITSSYCFVTIILARVFLKERLTKKQYLSVALVIAGIALLGISEIFNA